MIYSVMVLILVCAFFILWYVVAALGYQKTDYAKATHKSFLAMWLDKGSYGEYLTYKYLRKYEESGAKFLYNCYLPRDKGQTTEIDVMMIHSSGVYVFESKNYSGWIFGSENQKTWTQTLPNGRKSHKEHFLNPIMQNKLHIKWLLNQIGEDTLVHSIIVFSERCTLKKVEVTSPEIRVIKRDNINRVVKETIAKSGVCLTQERIAEIYQQLYPFTQVTEELKKQHIQDIEETHKPEEKKTKTKKEDVKKPEEKAVEQQKAEVKEVEKPMPEEAEETAISSETNDAEQICPRCGSKLVLRTTVKGENAGKQFYGCSSYPKCRYMKKIES